ncbi:MAG: polyprenyl synthetase family protein [Pseudomonadota bacterium]
MTAQSLASAAPTPLVSSLDAARDYVASEMNEVNGVILDRLQSEVSLIPQLARHLIAAGGKRIRPTLTLLSARLCEYYGVHHVGLAAAVEFIHTATLLHDDVVDHSDLRRGSATANAVFGNKSAVLVGDFLFSRAFQLMVSAGNLRVLEILSSASAIIAEGEVAQLITANDTSTDEAAYMHVIRAKTAALFEAACQIAPVIAERGPEDEAALAAYGASLGIAFQLVDDALDYSAAQALLGKTVGDDFRDGKITLPIVFAIAEASTAEQAFWQRTLEEGDQRDGDLTEAQRILKRHRAVERTIDRAYAFGEDAKLQLDRFQNYEARNIMSDLVDFAVQRAY